MLSTIPVRPRWDGGWGKINLDPAGSYQFEPYHTRNDWTRFEGISAKYPANVREMTDLTFAESAKHQVLPRSRGSPRHRRPLLGHADQGIPGGTAPNALAARYTITADIGMPKNGADGVIVTNGRRFGGYGQDLLKGRTM